MGTEDVQEYWNCLLQTKHGGENTVKWRTLDPYIVLKGSDSELYTNFELGRIKIINI